MKSRQINEINNKLISEFSDIKSLNNKVNSLNDNLNELFKKYKTVKKKRKIEEEKERKLNNRLKRLISKEAQLIKKKEKEREKEIKKQMDLLDKSKYSKYNTLNNRQIYNGIENKEIFIGNNRNIMSHNNSMKMINSLELKECNDIKKKIYRNKERNKSGLNKLVDNSNFKTINLSNKTYFLNNDDKSFNFFDNCKKEISYPKKIIKIINNGKKVQFNYNYNNIKEYSNSNNNNNSKIKTKNQILNIKKTKVKKNSYCIRKEENKKNNNINVEINNKIYKESTEKNECKKIIHKFNSPIVYNYWKENEKEKKYNEEERKKINETNIKDLKNKNVHKKINTNNILFHTLTKNDWKSKINFQNKNYSKSPNRNQCNSLSENKNNFEKTNIYLLEKMVQSPLKEEKTNNNKKNIDVYENTLLRNSIIKKELEKKMIHSKTIDYSPSNNNNKKSLRNNNLSFSKNIEEKRSILGLNSNNEMKNKKKKKVYNFEEEIKVTEHILSCNNSGTKILCDNSQTTNRKQNDSKKIIKVTKAGNLGNIGDKKIKNKNRKMRYNNTVFNLMFKKVLSANRSVESYDNIRDNKDRIKKHLSYKKLIEDQNKKSNNYNENISQKKKSMKKFDFYLTDNNFYTSRGKHE